jgi:adenosylhomocysteinase
MSFANQSLTAEYLTKERGNLEKKVYRVPESIDRNIAELKLDSLGVEIEELTEKQKEYLASWQMGT